MGLPYLKFFSRAILVVVLVCSLSSCSVWGKKSTDWVAPKSPWHIWLPVTEEPLATASKTEDDGNLEEADVLWREIEETAADPLIARYAFLRRMGVYFKMGHSSDVLTEMRQRIDKEERSPAQLSSAECLYLGFAYGFENNTNQALAWFNEASKRSNLNPEVQQAADEQIADTLGELTESEFSSADTEWHGVGKIGKPLERENLRRAKGGLPEPARFRQFSGPGDFTNPDISGDGQEISE